MFKIPIVDLRAQYRQLCDERMAAYLGCGFAVGVASGSDALLLALMALGVGPGDAVITTPFTFFSTVSSITRLGAKPLFVDIDPATYLLADRELNDFLRARAQIAAGGCAVDNKTGLRLKALLQSTFLASAVR
jgi:dTDP-4-amino-4,6-dideoxygalactose transaminase